MNLLCLDDRNTARSYVKVVRGFTYTLKRQKNCPNCGFVLFDVGYTESFGVLCGSCDAYVFEDGVHWLDAKRFTVVPDNISSGAIEYILNKNPI